jgi:lipopolysaccharide biosynthesis glycosyltransferase
VDANFLPYVGVVAASMARTASLPVDYIVFHDGPASRDAEALDGYTVGRLRVSLRPASRWAERYGDVGGLPPIALLRLRLQDELPTVDEIIYLDSDLLVLRDIKDLADFDLNGSPIAAAADAAYQPSQLATPRADGSTPPYDLERCALAITGLAGFAPGEYINSGVMRMNLAALRAEGFGETASRMLDKWNRLLRLRDQDVFNIALRGRIRHLDPTWNRPVGAIIKQGARLPFGLGFKAESNAPAIVHFAGTRKPWLTSRPLPFSGAWWHFARRAPTAETIARRYRQTAEAARGTDTLARTLATVAARIRYAG